MNSNPLPPIWQAYKTAQDSFRIAKRAIKTEYPPARQRLLQRTEVTKNLMLYLYWHYGRHLNDS